MGDGVSQHAGIRCCQVNDVWQWNWCQVCVLTGAHKPRVMLLANAADSSILRHTCGGGTLTLASCHRADTPSMCERKVMTERFVGPGVCF